jgi:hypothetical protein
MAKELVKAENMLKNKNLYVSNENSLKLKIKLSTPTTPFIVTPSSSNISNNNNNTTNEDNLMPTKNDQTSPSSSSSLLTSKIKKKKEILNYGNMNLLDSIQLNDNNDDDNKVEKKEEKLVDDPPRIIMKLKAPINDAPQAPIKLKLKISNKDSTVTYIKPNDTDPVPSTKFDESNESDNFMRHGNKDDDEMLNDLKDSITDGDYVYPNLSLNKKEKITPAAADTLANDTSECKKSTRKRKLKPHAVQYLMPRETVSQAPSEAAVEKKPDSKPKKMIDKLIEKNLKPTLDLNQKKKTEKVVKTTTMGEDDPIDKTYTHAPSDIEDEDDDDEYNDDEDADFKLKCKNNLKLSKKIKNKLIKQQKKLDGTENPSGKVKTSSQIAAAAATATMISGGGVSKKSNNKKGLATAKQRLGKILKLNRIVNI